MSRKWQYVLWFYAAGAFLVEAMLVFGAYDNGGFQREHSARDLLVLAVLYFAAGALWPALILVVGLQYFGVLPPITF
jgi:hypothetical protein